MPTPPSAYRFADFSFDPSSGELKGAGGTTRLQPQVAALLDELVQHAGTVVTRAELQLRLWPDTTVEFDDGLNFCIRQLRVALGDDASTPTYIETLPKRGYRFLPAVTTDELVASTPVAGGRRWPIYVLAAGTIALLAVAAGTTIRLRRNPSQYNQAAVAHVTLGVVPFDADSTDPMIAAYRQRLFNQITRDARAESGWTVVTSPASTTTHVLSGSLTREGNSVKVFVQLTARPDGHKLWAEDIVDSYAFSGNSTMTADRIEKTVARILGQTSPK